ASRISSAGVAPGVVWPCAVSTVALTRAPCPWRRPGGWSCPGLLSGLLHLERSDAVRAEVRGLHDAARRHRCGLAFEDELPEVEDVDVGADAHDERHVVLDEQDPRASLGHDPL